MPTPRSFAYPDRVLFAPFLDTPSRRADARKRALADALSAEQSARAAYTAACSARYASREDREAALLAARVAVQGAKATARWASRGGGLRLGRSELVRAILTAASLSPDLPEPPDAGKGSGWRNPPTSVALSSTDCVLLVRAFPGITLERVVDRALASPAVVERTRAILLLSPEEQAALSADTLDALA